MQANSAAMDKLIAAAKAQGIKAENIQTSGINLSPQYDYSNRRDGQPPPFLGSQVTHSVPPTTNATPRMRPLLAPLAQATETKLHVPVVATQDPNAILSRTRIPGAHKG